MSMLHTEINLGRQGAKRQTWKVNPRELLKKVIDQHPSADEKTIKELMYPKIVKSDTLLEAIFDYWFANNYRSLVIHPTNKTQTKAASEETHKKLVSEIKQKHNIVVQKEARILLLNMTLPNGKLLRSSSGKECSKYGGFFSRIAKKISPTAIVGDVLSEAQLQTIYKQL